MSDETAVAVIATEVRLMKDEIGRRLDELRTEQRDTRTEMSANFVHHTAYQAEYGRVTDRIANVESDVIEIRTSMATQIIDLHGHIDRKFAEMTISRRWVVGMVITVVLALLSSATAIAIAVITGHG